LYGNGFEPDEVDDGMCGHHDTLVRLLAIHGEILHEISHVLRETKIEKYFYIHIHTVCQIRIFKKYVLA
jgi:hypothetical protein